ncbi:thymopoietin isoform X8 [Columba livia]|uniref:thymopoietin isoform X8 n=1 Tax=Columba livia TaxID=8932 RepID=UPI0031BB33C4
MPEFLADPSVLTKEKLKSELIANNVSLPGGEQRKDVYVQLYLQHLTARNPPAAAAQPDFSSDEEREHTPLGARNRGAAVGRKATKKTDKPRPEEKDDLDITEMSNEDLQEQLVKYGLNPGPIVATTRKLYEKKLLKLMEQGPELNAPVPLPAISSTAENNTQNGNNDSDQYSDNEEVTDMKTELRLEKREPLKARTKTPVALKQRRVVEQNQVVNRVPGNFKHAAPTLSISELSDMPGRTPKKPLMTAEQEETVYPHQCFFNHVGHKQSCDLLNTAMIEVMAKFGFFYHLCQWLAGTLYLYSVFFILKETEESTKCFKTPKLTRQLPLTKVLERNPTEERRGERDILKEMFPHEVSTPTGISASCRRPIKGAASRPIEHSDFRMEESFSKYVPKYGISTDSKSEKQPTKKERSIPLWIKILLFVIVSVFLFLVYQSMETNQGNPFSKYMRMSSPGSAK